MPNRLLPLYAKIAENLRHQIICGDLSPDSRLPTQRELAEHYNTTLMTVRQALGVLEEENLIRTEHGIGSFVNSASFIEHDYNLLGFSNEMRQRALEIETKVLSIQEKVQNEVACQALQLPPDSLLVCLERLRLLDGIPIVYQRSFLPFDLTDIVLQYTPEISLYHHLHQHGGLLISNAREIIRPIALTVENAEILGRKACDPAFLSLRVSLHQDSRVIIYDEAYLVGDSFVIELERYGQRNSFQFHLLDSQSPDPMTLLIEND